MVVTLGYMQITGIDDKERFYPVATAIKLKTGIEITLYSDVKNWIHELVDVESSFLEGKLKTKVYINSPQGMVELGFMSQ